MRKLSILFALLMFFCMSGVQAQLKVSGKITSKDDGKSLPSATVKVKGTSTGTVADMNGLYLISVDSGSTLQYFYAGMKTVEMVITKSGTLDVVLESDIVDLEGVVITALGISREKKSLGYSVQDLSGSELVKARETNIVNSLSGKVSGVQITNSSGAVGASSRIVIRGASSLGSNNQPLFVVDGIPINNDNFGSTAVDGVNRGNGAADINPDDIKSISILKGPNAAALYGSRAANGVILITTKSGSLSNNGRGTGIGVEISNSTFFDRPFRLPDYQNSYGQGSKGQFSFLDGAGGGINDGTDESWGPKLDDGTKIAQFDSPLDANGNPIPTDWLSNPDNIKNFFETGITTATNVAVTGGNNNASFRVSVTNLNQKGMVPNTDYKKNTISIGANTNASEKLNISGSANYVQAKSLNMPGYGYDAQNVMQQFNWFGRQVDISKLKNYQNADGSKYNWNYNYHNNPYFTLNENLNGMKRDRFYGNTKAQYTFSKNLSAYVRTGMDFYSNLNTSRVAAGDIDNDFGSYSESMSTFREFNTDFLVLYNRKLNSTYDMSFNFGGSRMDQNYHNNFSSANELAVPGVYNVANSRVPLATTNLERNKRINSLYFSGQLGYKNAIFLDLTGRNDWSSTLPDGANSYFYPSVSLSTVFTELIKKNLKPLSYGKIRLGWSKVGSDTDPYQLVTSMLFGEGWNSSTKYLNQYVPNVLPNSELKPQFVNSIEVGTELKFFMDRISFDFTYYSQKTTDQIISIPVSAASGYTAKVINAGEIDNKGIEMSLSASVLKPKGKLKWNVVLNYARNTNEVVSLAEGVEQYELGTYWSMKVMAIPGQPFGSLYGYDYKRDPNGNIIYKNGLPMQGDLKVLGNFQPKWVGGITNEFEYKGITASFLVDFHMGGSLYSMTNAWGRYAGVLSETEIGREGGLIGDGVKEVTDANGKVTYVTNDVVVTSEDFNHASFADNIAAGSIFDASYIKLREIRLGYTFKKIKNLPIYDINISVVGRNLALLYSKVPHIDPETSFSNTNVQGLEFGQIPSARSIGFNISAKF